jgi:secondary thiamine-phosphate synthase enzyme
MHVIDLQTTERCQFLDVTERVAEVVRRAQLTRGAVVVYVPHTTAGCTINENADPDVTRDALAHFAKTIPHRGDYRHAEGNSDAHIKAATVGASQFAIVEDGELQLGRWQGIFFCEFDGPRRRQMYVQTLAAHD